MREKQPQAAKKSIKYGLLNDMSTETLKSMIQQDCFGTGEDQLDDDIIEMIIDIISQREPEESDVDIDALWNTFVTEYMPTVASSNLAALSSEPDVIRPKLLLSKKPLRTFRHILVAILLCLLLGNCVAFASGVNLFEYIARWTEDTFQFERIEDDSSRNTDFFDAAKIDIPKSQKCIKGE